MSAEPSARDRAAEAVADDGSPIRNMPRSDAIEWLQEVATSKWGGRYSDRAWAAARVLLAELAAPNLLGHTTHR